MTSNPAGRTLAVAYGVLVYALFLVTFVAAVAFVEDVGEVGGHRVLPHTLDQGGSAGTTAVAVIVDLALLALFAVQHSVMARPAFKRRWTRLVPPAIERSTYVLLATACLALLIACWQPVGTTVWELDATGLRAIVIGVSMAGWLVVLLSTFLIDHWDLFGLRQVLAAARQRTPEAYAFVTPLWYRLVRHPIYLGFLVAFWAAPTMTTGHLLFAIATSAYVLVGIRLEEHDLVGVFGEDYRTYRQRVPMLVPVRASRRVAR